MADERTDGRWVTLDNGVHLFIKKGQTLDDAIEKLENNPEKPKTENKIEKVARQADKESEESKKLYDRTKKSREEKDKEYEAYVAEHGHPWERNKEPKKETKAFIDSADKEENTRWASEIDKYADHYGYNADDAHAWVDRRIEEGASYRQAVEEVRDRMASYDSLAENYKGYPIEHNFYGNGEYTVQFEGDDVLFDQIEDAKKFIDEIKHDEESKNLSAKEYGIKYARKNERINDYTDQINESLGIGDLEEVEKNIKKDFLGGALTREERDKLFSQIDEAKEGYRQGAENYKKGIIEVHGHRWKEDKNGEIKSIQASDGHILKIGDKVSGYKITGFDPWTNSVLIDGSDYSVEDVISEITGKQYNDEISEEERKRNSKRTNKK